MEHVNRTVEDFQALLSPAALPLLEEIAQASESGRQENILETVYILFTPILYRKLCGKLLPSTAVLYCQIKFAVHSNECRGN